MARNHPHRLMLLYFCPFNKHPDISRGAKYLPRPYKHFLQLCAFFPSTIPLIETANRKPQHFKPQLANQPKTKISNLKPHTSNLKPHTSNLKPQTSDQLNPQTSNQLKPQTSNLKPTKTSNLKPQTN